MVSEPYKNWIKLGEGLARKQQSRQSNQAVISVEIDYGEKKEAQANI
jgi:hypothetical protein